MTLWFSNVTVTSRSSSKQAHPKFGSKFPPKRGTSGTPEPGGSFPLFSYYTRTSFYDVPTAQFTHFVHELASSTSQSLLGAAPPNPHFRTSTNVPSTIIPLTSIKLYLPLSPSPIISYASIYFSLPQIPPSPQPPVVLVQPSLALSLWAVNPLPLNPYNSQQELHTSYPFNSAKNGAS